jgi:hypothetical protein
MPTSLTGIEITFEVTPQRVNHRVEVRNSNPGHSAFHLKALLPFNIFLFYLVTEEEHIYFHKLFCCVLFSALLTLFWGKKGDISRTSPLRTSK